jgi:hypothetical protein
VIGLFQVGWVYCLILDIDCRMMVGEGWLLDVWCYTVVPSLHGGMIILCGVDYEGRGLYLWGS